jgi:hypothetical protein
MPSFNFSMVNATIQLTIYFQVLIRLTADILIILTNYSKAIADNRIQLMHINH